ncbi:hypothetical protein [Paenibacillus polymyxa]|uniref:hypothetical protein n=1 Tax=Paenibacillus polymyxa TaxID=1406 RepID=UPI0025B68FCF|nr:hypothetical protein [Paenibacillus polymyxa]MDN4090913.1 hypothetical protein [Paenibacillus polymyxa]
MTKLITKMENGVMSLENRMSLMMMGAYAKGRSKLMRFHKGERGDGGGVPGWVIGLVIAAILAIFFLTPAKDLITKLFQMVNDKVSGAW